MASSSLHDACRTGAIDDVRRILDAEPDLLNRPRPDDGCAPLHHAAFGGQLEVVDELLRRGASVGARDRTGYTPLHYSAIAGATDVARRLIAEGVDLHAPNDSNTSVLHMAAAGGSLDLVDELLERGLAPDIENLYGETPLHRAAQRDRLDVVRRLADLGAPIDAADRYLLRPVQKATIGGAVDVLEWLVSAGASLGVSDLLGDTPLHAACGMGRTETARRLLDHSAAVDARNAERMTPLHAAAQRGDVEAVELLLERGADPSAVDALERSPLHIAAAAGSAEVIAPLVAAGSRLDGLDAGDRTPLDAASFYGRRKAHRILADHGAEGGLDPAAARTLVAHPSADDELAVWHLGTSGWALRTASHFLVIDAVPDAAAGEEASLLNGQIVAEELPDLPIAILISHHHADHFSPRMLELGAEREVRFAFGWDAPVETAGHRFTGPGEACVDGVHVAAVPSTDTGSAFLIEVDGFRIYHAGDHAASEIPPEEAFTSGIAALERFAPIDLAFLPVFGCGLPNVESLRAGNDWAIARLAPRAVFPMHVGWTGHFYREEAGRLVARGFAGQVVAVSRPGDRYVYRDGSIEPLMPVRR